MGAKRLYFTEGQEDRVETLMQALDADGVDLRDNRGNLSISALIRYLVDKELAARGLIDDKKPAK